MTEQEQQEYLAEMLRMAERYKAGAAGRRVPAAGAAQLPGQPAGNAYANPTAPEGGPDLDEYAYTGTPSPPVTHQESQYRPKLSTEYGQGPFPPLQAPGPLDPRTATPVPRGYTYGDDQITRDPNGVPAWEQKPPNKDVAWDALTAVNPSIGGSLRMGVTKGAGAGAHYGQMAMDLADEYVPKVGSKIRELDQRFNPVNYVLPRSLPPEPPKQKQGPPEAALRSYTPSWREQLTGLLQGPNPSPERRRTSEGLTKIADFVPGAGQVLGFEEAARQGDPQRAAMAVMSIPGAKVRPGTWYHGLSENKLRRPLEEMSATRLPVTELAPRKIITPSELQGEMMTPLPGDRTAAGLRLTAVNEQPLAHGVELQGGPDYMRANDALWASQKTAANSFQNRATRLAEETGQAPLAVYTAMSPTGGDYAHMTADTLIGMLPSQKISQKNLAKFRAAMKDRGYPIPEFSPDNIEPLRQALMGPESGRAREAFVQEMATRPFQDARFPDVGSARFATTEPALLHDPSLSSGYMIGRTAPGQPTVTNPAQHMTYSTQIPGQAAGGFEFPLPKDTMWLDYYRGRAAQGKTNPNTSNEDYAFRLKQPNQKATQEWVDTAEEYQRRRRAQAR